MTRSPPVASSPPMPSPADYARVVELVARTSDPRPRLLPADRRRGFMSGLAQLIAADVWLWSSTVANHAQPGDFMTTCMLDGGWRSQAEQAGLYHVIADPDFGCAVQQPVYSALRSGAPALLRGYELFAAADSKHLQQWLATGFEHSLIITHPVCENFSSNCGLHRRSGKPAFAAREEALATLAFHSVAWLHDFEQPKEELGDTLLSLPLRQREVLLHILAGAGQKEIAARLGISSHTVDDYLKQIHRRFGVSSRAELQARFYLGQEPREQVLE